MANLTYNPAFFDAADETEARAIILTREGEMTTDERWARETPYLTDLIGKTLEPSPGMRVLDYGCGIGRLSKALIERFGCDVIGVDISADMRRLAVGYVASPRFTTTSPEGLTQAGETGLLVDAAISIWVLQHCLAPAADIDRIAAVLRPGGRLFVANNERRAIPTRERRWGDDGLHIRGLLGKRFTSIEDGRLDAAFVGPLVAQMTFAACYERPAR
jgi:cyclopropane fatty-acyl-phospholipid synthase-like methyltransferase